MKPLILEMAAFGPYAAVERVNFKELKDKNIFLITGPTGAGKTTIFDAISFALFGEASGESRDRDGLRSGFASEDTPTYVALEFELKGKSYKITRYPQQYKKKARGEGFILKTTEAELLLPDSEVITKVGNVDEKINELLGINKLQFKQIVMLAQGEFRKLLEADSTDREKIFRKIFNTEAFERIQRKILEQKSELGRGILDKRKERDTYMKGIEGCEEVLFTLLHAEELNVIEIMERTVKVVQEDEIQSTVFKEEIERGKAELSKVEKTIIEAQENNRKIKETLELEVAYKEMYSKEEIYSTKTVQLSQGRKAFAVKISEENFKNRQMVEKSKAVELTSAEEKLRNAENKMYHYKEALEKEEKRTEEKKVLSNDRATLKSQEEKVKSYEEKITQIEDSRKDLKRIEEQKKLIKDKLQQDKRIFEKVNKEITELQIAETLLVKLQKSGEERMALLQETSEFLKDFTSYSNYYKEHEKKSSEFADFEKNYYLHKNKYENMEMNFRKGQAGLLARDLEKGMPCPVCGGCEHPNLAVLLAEIPTEEAMKEAKKCYDGLSEERIKKLNELATLEGSKKEFTRILGEKANKLKVLMGEEMTSLTGQKLVIFVRDKNENIKVEVKEILTQQELLSQKIVQKPLLEEKNIKVKDKIAQNENTIEILEREYVQCFGKVKMEEEGILSIEKDIPIEIRGVKALNEKITKLEKEFAELEAMYKAAQQQYNQAVIEVTSAGTDKEMKIQNLKEVKIEVVQLQEKLEEQIAQAGFASYEEYASMAMSEKEFQLLEKEIAAYYENLKSLKDRYEQALKRSESLEIVEIEKIKEVLEQISLEQEDRLKKEKELYARIKNNKRALLEINKINELIGAEEEKYSIIADLAKITNGDNEQRISFERYVLAAYFDEILLATNGRLSKMTGGRFTLMRSKEKGKGRKQEGLELEVFDNYTGKARHVTTLSGGESFKASLAMALGLADVVQEYAGGISLDTIFIDEGFGTLDPESLDNAIQCLFDLQQGGRLVGVISHVNELKERIEARLEVTPAKEGSKVRVIC